jgi:TRAP-type mannitol/chloroaromatic compound transport system permease small subunit
MRSLQFILKFIDVISIWSGKLVAWLCVPLTGALVIEVISRYLLGRPTIWAFDVSYMLYGTHFMIGATYLLYLENHIRIEDLYRLFSPRKRALIDVCFYLLVFFPVTIVLFESAIDFAERSWVLRERGMLSPWRPPLYPFKTVFPVALFLLLLQGVAQFVRKVQALKGA